MLPSCLRLDLMVSLAPASPLPGPPKHDQVHLLMKTLEPLSPSKVNNEFNASDDDAFLSFMDPFVSLPGLEGPPASGRSHATPVVDRSPGTKMCNARRCQPQEPAQLGDASTFKKRITSNTYLRRLYLTRQQVFELAPSVASLAEMHDQAKDPATTVSARVAILDERNVPHDVECKCYLSSREHHFVLCNGWGALSKASGFVMGDCVVFRKVGQGCFQVVRVKGGG